MLPSPQVVAATAGHRLGGLHEVWLDIVKDIYGEVEDAACVMGDPVQVGACGHDTRGQLDHGFELAADVAGALDIRSAGDPRRLGGPGLPHGITWLPGTG